MKLIPICGIQVQFEVLLNAKVGVVRVYCEPPSYNLVCFNVIRNGSADFVCKPRAGCVRPMLDGLRSCPFRSSRVCDTCACPDVSKTAKEGVCEANPSFRNPPPLQRLASKSRVPSFLFNASESGTDATCRWKKVTIKRSSVSPCHQKYL
jgi:hypothetical protein